jgi:serine O-acetyltransferase
MIGSGARVLGPFRVGRHAKVAAGAVVLSEVPDDATAVGVPARIVRVGGVKVDQTDVDQLRIPDPISQELEKLEKEISDICKRIGSIRNDKREDKNEGI